MRFRTTSLQTDKTATGIRVPTASFVRDKLYTLAPTYEASVTLELSAAEAASRMREVSAEIEPIDGGRSRLQLASDTIEWLAIRLLLLDCEFTVDRPQELRSYMGVLGDRLSRAAG